MEKKKVKSWVDKQLNDLDRGIVATPTRDYLESFAKANNGTNDFLLMQMGINFGAKIILEQIKEIYDESTI